MSPSMTPRETEHGESTSMFALTTEPTPLPARFARIKETLISGKETEIVASWKRLLTTLKEEIDIISSKGADIFPTTSLEELKDPDKLQEFSAKLKDRGAAVIRGVVPRETAEEWKKDTDLYLDKDDRARRLPTHDPHLYGVYWAPAQIKARADKNVLFVQRLLMNLWHSSDPSASVSPNYPVTYADRLRMRSPDDEPCSLSVYVDGGSVERWEPDGYGAAYKCIWDGRWEDYDPWESSARLKVTSDLYNGDGACSMFRMFQGLLSLNDLPFGEGIILLCPAIRITTAYLLLRPFFSPVNPSTSHPDFLSPDNWTLESPPSSIIQGALPSYPQELNEALHPHLQLTHSMVHIPRLAPGDYLVWHCDAVYALDRRRRPDLPTITVLHLPACPLTQTNALFLARQRKAFLFGNSSPDFGGVHGESARTGNEGVQEVGEAGGVEGMRAMGLLPWEEEDAKDDDEQAVLEMANGILFPEKYDMAYY